MRIGVVGMGAIGGFLAAKLAAQGAEVAALARGATLEALRADGLTLISRTGDVSVRLAAVSDAAADLGPVDLWLFTVKGQDSEAAADAIAPAVGPATRVLSFQNGLFGLEVLTRRFGAERVLGGVTYVPATVERPGLVRHTGPVTRCVFGPSAGGGSDEAANRFAALAQQAGLDIALLDDPTPEIWAKFVMLAPFHCVAATTRLALGAWRACPETLALFRTGMEEVAAVAAAKGVALPDGLIARNMAFTLETADPGTRASMLDDLERGKPLELDSSIGWLLQQARALDVPAPMHAACYALLKPYAEGPPG
ncbi:MAG: 2-dehydropantoate 2-reductase [Alphaproteobacteria bacterium]|nr:2-dehydropantoate 2-reductase [Alphaproteobacteria bacterium]